MITDDDSAERAEAVATVLRTAVEEDAVSSRPR